MIKHFWEHLFAVYALAVGFIYDVFLANNHSVLSCVYKCNCNTCIVCSHPLHALSVSYHWGRLHDPSD